MKGDKQLKDLEKMKSDQGKQQFQTSAQQAPLDQLVKQLGNVEESIRKQQYETETNLNDAFSQTANELAGTKAIKQMMQLVNDLSNLVNNQGLQGSAGNYHQLLGQLDGNLNQQIQAGSEQAAKSLQQSVNALAQANAALLNNQSYHQILHYVHQCQLLLANWEAAGSSPVH